MVWAKDGQLWEDGSSHCSCNGLWDDGPSPEATSVEAFLMRKDQDPRLIAALVAWVQTTWHAKAGERGATLAVPTGRATSVLSFARRREPDGLAALVGGDDPRDLFHVPLRRPRLVVVVVAA